MTPIAYLASLPYTEAKELYAQAVLTYNENKNANTTRIMANYHANSKQPSRD